MRSLFTIVIAVVIVVGFLLYMMSYTVRFTDAAIVTTFGKVGEKSVVTEPGLKFKLPAPLQSVTIYDTRAHVLQAQPETQQTADNRPIAISAFLAWRVANPIAFYRSFRDAASGDARLQYQEAEKTLLARLRSALAEASNFRLDELFASGAAGGSKLSQLEANVLANIKGDGLEDLGVEVVLVGVNNIELPDNATNAVFERMKASRENIAAAARQEGLAEAERIRGAAEAAVEKIESFASTRAAEIRRRGEAEAAAEIARLDKHQDLAILLAQTEAAASLAYGRGVFVVDQNVLGFSLLAKSYREYWEDRAAEDAERFAREDAGDDAAVQPAIGRARP